MYQSESAETFMVQWTPWLKLYHTESTRLINRRPELKGSPTAFCSGCFGLGFLHDGQFAGICEAYKPLKGELGAGRVALRENVACTKCTLGLAALLILGSDITCTCKPHSAYGLCPAPQETLVSSWDYI
jgi:hypothetical protein